MNERIQIGYYIGVVFKWLWLIILLVLATSGLTAYFSFNTPKQYVSTERILLTPVTSNDLTSFYANGTAQSLADSYGTYMQSYTFGQEVAAKATNMVPPLNPGEVVGSINGSLVKANAVFYDVSAQSSSPERAQAIVTNAVNVLINGYNKATKPTDPTVQKSQEDQLATINEKINLYQNRSKDIDKQIADLATTPVAEGTPVAQRDNRVDVLYAQQQSITNIISTLETSLSSLQQTMGGSEKAPAATIIDSATLGSALPNNATRNIGIVAILTLVFGIGMALLFDFLDFTIKAADDLENLLKVAPLGVIGKINSATLSRLAILAATRSLKVESTPQTEALVESLHHPDPVPHILGQETQFIGNDVTAGSADSGTPGDEPGGMLPVNPTPSAYQVRLITHLQPKSTIAEAFRVLRTNILFSRIDKPLRSLSVTSSVQGEGKTVTAGNLAVVFAQAGKTVLLIDADLRRPRLHTMFDLPNTVGFSNVCLEGIDNHPDSIYETSVRRLLVMPSGPIPPNPSELLGSRRVEELLIRVRDYIDVVIFDTPPAAAVTDAMVLATKVDGVLIVVQAGRTRRDIILKTFQSITKVGGSTLGPVLNQVSEQSLRSYYYYNYGYGYGYYEDSSETSRKNDKSKNMRQKATSNSK